MLRLAILAWWLIILLCSFSEALTAPDNARRHLLWKAPLGAVGIYSYGRLAYNAFSVNGISYPPAHEERVASTISTGLLASSTSRADRPTLRVLEVGIGTDARLIRRDLYDPAVRNIVGKYNRLEITGLDLHLPNQKALSAARTKLDLLGTNEGMDIDLQTVQGSIESVPQFPDGYFDSIICCLTLCSVENPLAAVQEMKRLLQRGGTLGYVEHVAVADDAHSFLDLQQRLLDPIQQRVADNCHLHRNTESTIASVFDSRDGAKFLNQERFYVDNMWPVSCQCSGVLQQA